MLILIRGSFYLFEITSELKPITATIQKVIDTVIMVVEGYLIAALSSTLLIKIADESFSEIRFLDLKPGIGLILTMDLLLLFI